MPAPRRSPGLLADDDVAARTLGLEPGRDVQGIADEVGVARPDHDLTGVHRDPQRELDSVRFHDGGGEVDESILKFDRGIDGAAGVVGSDLGNAPDGHEPVADVLGDARPVALGGSAEDAVIAAHDVARGLRVDLLLEGRRTGQVGEHHGHGLARRARGCAVRRASWPDRRAARRTLGRIARWPWPRPRTFRRRDRAARRSPRRTGRPLRSRRRRRRRRAGARPRQSGLRDKASWSSIAVAARIEHGVQQLPAGVRWRVRSGLPQVRDRRSTTPW